MSENKSTKTGGQGDVYAPVLTYSPALERRNGTYGTRAEKARRNEAQRQRIKPVEPEAE